jgi:hypothetical protein
MLSDVRGRAGLLVAAVTAGAALAPGAAADVDVLRGMLKPVGPSEQVSQRVPCPDGLRVVGGGAYTSGSSLEDEVSDSAPFDGKDADAKPDDGWIGAVNGGGEPEEMRTWAICTDAIKLSYSSALAQPVSFGGEAEAPCPAGQDPVGGGMRVKGKTTTSPLKASIQNALVMGWQSAAINVPDPPNLATGYAICSPSNRVEHAGGSQNMTAGDQDDLEMPCPSGTRILSGGGAGISSNQLEIASLLPSDAGDQNARPDDAWTMWFNNESVSSTGSMNSHAFCLD